MMRDRMLKVRKIGFAWWVLAPDMRVLSGGWWSWQSAYAAALRVRS